MFKLPVSNDDNLIIYTLYLPKYYSLISYFKAMISYEEQNKAHSFVSHILSDNYIITHGMLRYILAYHTKLYPEQITYNFNKYGKPSINHKLYFNISHAKDYAVYAISKSYEVGIDVEYIAPIEVIDLAKYVLHNEEYKIIAKLESDCQLKKFYHIWVIKEAITKLIGLGLSLDITTINTVNTCDTDICYMYKNENFFCHSIPIDNKYVSSVAIKSNTHLPNIVTL